MVGVGDGVMSFALISLSETKLSLLEVRWACVKVKAQLGAAKTLPFTLTKWIEMNTWKTEI